MQLVFVFLFISFFVFLINVIPAFMPATWMLLAFVYVQYHLPFLPLVILGAIFSTLGRVSLYYLSHTQFRHFFPKISQENMAVLGKYLNKRKNLTIPFVLFFALLPLPSNVVFIGAGIARFDLKVLSIGFFLGRLANYTVLVSSSGIVANELGKIVHTNFTLAATAVIEILGFGLLFLFAKINWGKILKGVL